MDELDEAWAAAEEYELLWHRAREAARGARKGIERLQAKVRRLEEQYRKDRMEIASLWSQNARLESDRRSLENKVQRLSLRLIAEWGGSDAAKEG